MDKSDVSAAFSWLDVVICEHLKRGETFVQRPKEEGMTDIPCRGSAAVHTVFSKLGLNLNMIRVMRGLSLFFFTG